MRTFVLVLAIVCSTSVYAETLTGPATILDADTIVVHNERIRLQGIAAPETDQICLDEPWGCGLEARDQFIRHIGIHPTSCVTNGRDRYARLLATCSTDQGDLGMWLVREGFALAYTKYSTAYVADEAIARTTQKGMWAGAFITPWDWRHRSVGTTLLGAYKPIAQQANLLLSVQTLEQACVIKGNINSHGERIYHLPGQRFYEATVIDTSKGERWFCSEEDAVAAGWRRSKV